MIAISHVGFAFERGLGVQRDKTKAAEWYLKAAENGLAEAQNNIGVFFELGIGVKQDSQSAGYWYKKAAEQGNAGAQGMLLSLHHPRMEA